MGEDQRSDGEMMAGFEDAWSAVASSRQWGIVSPDLKPLLGRVYSALMVDPPDLPSLKKSLEQLLTFLAGAGRTNANCRATDSFFMLPDGWERDWSEAGLPDDFHDVFALMGEALHDTVQAPKIAANFDCLPEQILEKVRKLKV